MTIDILLSPNDSSASEINSLCLGSGRFLRSVLVPFLASHSNPAVFQTRGRGFVDFFLDKNTNPTADNDGADVTRTTSLQYPISTMHQNGLTSTSLVSLSAAGTLGTPPGNSYLMNELISNSNSAGGIKCLEVIGVGVTEAGLLNASRKNGTMRDLTELLFRIYQRGLLINKVNDNNGDGDNEDGNANSDGGNTAAMMICPNPNGRICIINTDNVPKNGDVIRNLVLENAKEFYGNDDAENNNAENENNINNTNKGTFLHFLRTRISFLNTMVDRITSSQPNSNGLIPLCEPLPAKALVICDPEHDLPLWMTATTTVQQEYGVKIRHSQKELEMDMKLKLRVANGTHTAVAHVMALSSLVTTESLYDDDGDGNLSNATTNTNTDTTDTTANNPTRLLLPYLDSLYQTQILPAATLDDIPPHETDATWHDWRRRLQHPHFGLSTFFITQNGAAKGGIRLGPSVKCLIVGSVGVGGGKEVRRKPIV